MTTQREKQAVKRTHARKAQADLFEQKQVVLRALMDQINTNYPRLAQPAPLRNVYVAPTGSDSSGSGTSVSPWKSLLFGLNQANSLGPGTRVNVAPGNYTETFMPSNIHGNSTNPIEMVSTGGPSAAVNLWGMDCANLSYLRIQGIKFRGNSDGTNSYAQKFSNGAGSELIAINSGRFPSGSTSAHVELLQCEVTYGTRSGILMGEGTQIHILACNIHHNCITAAGGPASTGAGAGLDHGIYNSNAGQNCLIMNCLLHNNLNGYGISNYPGNDLTGIIANTIVKNGKGGVSVAAGSYDNVNFFHVTNAKIYNNVIGPQVARGTYSFSGGYGIITYQGPGAPAPTGIADYNIVFGDTSYNNSTQSPFVWGSNNVQADPLYNDLTNNDFRLKPGSPAIGTAFADWEPNYDYTLAVRS